MFTDLHEEISATFARLEGCLSVADYSNYSLMLGPRPDTRTADDHKRAWKKQKARLQEDEVFRESRRAYMHKYNLDARLKNPEAYKARLKDEANRIASDPELRRRRNKNTAAWRARKRAEKVALPAGSR